MQRVLIVSWQHREQPDFFGSVAELAAKRTAELIRPRLMKGDTHVFATLLMPVSSAATVIAGELGASGPPQAFPGFRPDGSWHPASTLFGLDLIANCEARNVIVVTCPEIAEALSAKHVRLAGGTPPPELSLPPGAIAAFAGRDIRLVDGHENRLISGGLPVRLPPLPRW